MGLDIYLYKTKDLSEHQKRSEQHEDFTENLWSKHEKYEDFSEEEKEEIRIMDKQNEEDLLIADGLKYAEERVEFDDKENPDHYFKIGYLRSSYNNGGINSVLRNLNIPDLYYIFDKGEDDGYMFEPNWQNSLIRCNEVIELLKSAPPYSVSKYGGLSFSTPTIKSEADALAAFLKEIGRNSTGAYSNSIGTFYREEPPVIHAFIDGLDSFGRSCIYTIQDAKHYDWYIKALEITKRTIEYAMSQNDKMQYYLHWSG